MSQQSSLSSCQSHFRQFQEKADEAGLIVFVLSTDFATSCFARGQVSFRFNDNYEWTNKWMKVLISMRLRTRELKEDNGKTKTKQ